LAPLLKEIIANTPMAALIEIKDDFGIDRVLGRAIRSSE